MAESMDAAVENMLKSQAARLAGQEFSTLLGAEAAEVPAAQTLPPPTTAELAYTVSGEAALISQRPAETWPEEPPVGLSEMGWSAEVTARDQRLVAATMAELAGEGGGGGGSAEPIDPTDPDALAAASRELGFASVRANLLRNAAIELNNQRLTEGLVKAALAEPFTAAANAGAVERIQADVDARSSAGAAAPAPAAAPKTTTTTSRTSSTSTSSSAPSS